MTPLVLMNSGVAPLQAQAFAGPLTVACERFSLSLAAQAALTGQCMVESSLFTRLEEALYYTHAERIAAVFTREVPNVEAAAPLVGKPQALANRVYAGRNGNGDEASGDGWRYRGRGLLQVTGRANYAAAASATGRDYVGSPQLVSFPDDAALTAAWFFHAHALATCAEAGDIDAVTRAVNPAMEQAELRRQYSQRVLAALRTAS